MRKASVLLCLLILAGCAKPSPASASDEGAPWPSDWVLRAFPDASLADHHDHRDPAHHKNLSTPNFEVVGYSPIPTRYYGTLAGNHLCGDAADTDGRDLMVYQSMGSDVGLVVIDITDRSQPRLVGELSLPTTARWDAAITDDARFAFIAVTTPKAPGRLPTAAFRAAWTDACGTKHEGPEQYVPMASGVLLVDLRTPEDPRIIDYYALPPMSHSVHSTTIGTATYVVVSSVDDAASEFHFLTLDQGPGGPRLFPYGVITSWGPKQPLEQAAYNVAHTDATIQRHPKTGQLLAYLASWDLGVQIYELKSPGALEYVSHWTDFRPEAGPGMTGAIHQAVPLRDPIDGRHITLLGQETGAPLRNRFSGQTILLDTSDPRRPTPVARWTPPIDPNGRPLAGLAGSLHYADIHDGYLSASMYHGGVWVAPVAPAYWPELPTAGLFSPDREPPQPGAQRWFAPVVGEVNLMSDGVLAIVDGASGAYTVRFLPEAAVPLTRAWTQDAWIGKTR